MNEETNNYTVEVSVQKLEAMLQAHDWYYDYSLDSKVYHAGAESLDEIYGMMTQLRHQGQGYRAKQLWEKYCPWYQPPSAGQQHQLTTKVI